LLPLGAISAVAMITPAIPAPPAGLGWTDASLDVVGSPVTVGGVVVVLDVVKHQLELTAVRPSDGAPIWHHAYATSLITPGVAFAPTVIGTTVLALSPSATVGEVTIEGLDAASGSLEWSITSPILAADAPAVCAGGRDFCIAAYTQVQKTALILINATSGAVSTLAGPARNMGVAAPGAPNMGELWQTDGVSPTFTQVSTTGASAWTRSVAGIFGGTEYSPDYGWDFLVQGKVDVGSVGIAPVRGVIHIGDDKTVAIDAANGKVAWSTPGLLLCEGPLQILAADVVCRYSGTVSASHASAPATLTLAGIDPTSGTTVSSRAISAAVALEHGNGAVFADSTHLVVRSASKGPMLLDVRTGAMSQPGAHEVFWCEETPTYTLTTPKQLSQYATHASEPVFLPCSASGAAATGLPSSSPPTVGIAVAGMFIWPTPGGLQARSAANSR